MVEQILFVLLAIITLGSALVVVTNRNLFHAALALMVTFAGVAGVYITLDAGFLAMAQLLVYIGAISILIIFAIMMTRRLMQAVEMPFNSQRWLGLFGGIITFIIVVVVVGNYWSVQPGTNNIRAAVDPEVLNGSVARLGVSFVNPDAYVIPFEVASVLLLAALVGAIVVAWPKVEDQS